MWGRESNGDFGGSKKDVTLDLGMKCSSNDADVRRSGQEATQNLKDVTQTFGEE